MFKHFEGDPEFSILVASPRCGEPVDFLGLDLVEDIELETGVVGGALQLEDVDVVDVVPEQVLLLGVDGEGASLLFNLHRTSNTSDFSVPQM